MRQRNREGDYCMVGFRVGNTMSESGTVARGVCELKDGCLETVVERTAIGYNEAGEIVFTDENGVVQKLHPNTPVSMNMWGFTPDYFRYSEQYFVEFLKENLNAPKAEFFIPLVVNEMINSGKASVKVLDTTSKWFGVTYQEDKESVKAGIQSLYDKGCYPEPLWK